MRTLILLLTLTLLLASCCPNPPQAPTDETSIAREAELLIRASLTDRLMENAESFYRAQVTPMLAERGIAPENARRILDTTLPPLLEAEEQRLVDALVPIYLRFYTADELHQLLSFYQTEVARKSMRVSPQIAAESQEYVRLWNENLGEQLLKMIDVGLGK